MHNTSDIAALGSIIFSICTLFLHLWGSKKDRTNGELTAQNLSITAADNVRKEMEQVIQRSTERLEGELKELKTERKEWEAERRAMVDALHQFEKRALVAEERLAAMEQRLADSNRLAAIETRLAELKSAA